MKVLRRGLSILLVLILVLPLLSVPALADDSADVSFYEMSSAASAYLSNELATKGSSADIDGLTSCSAGGLLGYSDAIDESNFVSKWIMSKLSSSSATIAYDSLFDIKSSNGDGGFYAYVRYGQMLRQIGFDNTATEMTSVVRKFGGYFLLLGYNIARVVPGIFHAVISILEFLNPFRLINTGHPISWVDAENRRHTVDYLEIGGIGDSGAAPVAAVFGDLYRAFYKHIATIVFVALFVILITHLLFDNLGGKNKNGNWPRVKSFIIRSVAMFVGVPICATLYSQALSMLGDMTSDNNFAASRIVASTFVDFEGWAREFQLANPGVVDSSNGRVLFEYSDKNTSTVSSATYVNLQKSCYNINRAVWAKEGKAPTDSSTIPDEMYADVDDMVGSRFVSDLTDTSASIHNGSSDDTGLANVIDDLLTRYAHGDFYYSGAWETYVRSNMSLGEIGGEEGTSESALAAIFKNSAKPSTFGDKIVGEGHLASRDADPIWGASGWTSAVSSGSSNEKMTFYNARPLSVMAMYNYLSSEFGANSMTVYSSEIASSGFIRRSHFSVNLIGGGILGFLYYLDSIVLIWTMAVIGFFYAMAVLFSNIKRLFIVFVAVFGTVTGSLKMFAKLLTFVVVMILEIIGTIFAYLLCTELLVALNQIVTTPLLGAISYVGAGNVVGGGIATAATAFGGLSAKPILIVCLIIDIVVMLLFLITALKVRKDIVKSIEEVASAFIDKVLGVQHQPLGGGSPGLGSRFGGAVAAGAGAAAAQRFLGGGSDDSDAGTKGTASAEENDGSKAPDGKDDGKSKDGETGDKKKTKAGESNGIGEGGSGSGSGSNGEGKESANPALSNGDDGSNETNLSEKDRTEIEDANSLEDVRNPDEEPQAEEADGAPVQESNESDISDTASSDEQQPNPPDEDSGESLVSENDGPKPPDEDKNNEKAETSTDAANGQQPKADTKKKVNPVGDDKKVNPESDKEQDSTKTEKKSDEAKTKAVKPGEKPVTGKNSDNTQKDAQSQSQGQTESKKDSVEKDQSEQEKKAKAVEKDAEQPGANTGVKSLHVDPKSVANGGAGQGGAETGGSGENPDGNPAETLDENPAETPVVEESGASTGVRNPEVPTEGVDMNGGTGGNPTSGNPTSGNPTSGNPTSGNPTSGNPTGGNPTGGNPTGGNPTGGNPTGGNPTGGNPTGGNPTGGNPTGGPVVQNNIEGDLGPVASAALNIEPESDTSVVTSSLETPSSDDGQQQTGEQPQQQTGEQPQQQTGEQPQQQTGGQSKQQTGEQPQQQTGGQSQQQTGEQPQQQTGGQSKQQTGGQSQQQTGERSQQQTGEQPKQQTGEQPKQPKADGKTERKKRFEVSREAKAAAVASFLASSDNPYLSQFGSTFGTATTMAITNQALSKKGSGDKSVEATQTETVVETETIVETQAKTNTSSSTQQTGGKTVVHTSQRESHVETTATPVEQVPDKSGVVKLHVKKRQKKKKRQMIVTETVSDKKGSDGKQLTGGKTLNGSKQNPPENLDEYLN